MDAIEKIPDGVRDKEAYAEMLKLQAHPMLSGDLRIVDTSDENVRVDLLTLVPHLRKMIAHLPEAEQKQIEAKCSIARSLQAKMKAQKRKAYGIAIHGKYSLGESLLDPRKSELLDLFGRFYSVADVHRIINRNWGFQISYPAVEQFRVKYLDKVRELQEDYSRSYSNIRLGQRRSRLEELSWMYEDMKERYVDSGSNDRYKLLLATLKDIKGEIDTAQKNKEVTETNVKEYLSAELLKETLKMASINDIVIGRIAARLNVNAGYIISRLHLSFYAKFNGFSFDETTDLDATPVFPSSFVYDMDSIKAKEEERKKNEAEKKRFVGIPAKEDEALKSTKDKLIEALRRKQAELNASVNRTENYNNQ